jgi:hypothetical protein
MPDGLLRIYTPIRDDTEIMLRVAGMMYCNDAEYQAVRRLPRQAAARAPSPRGCLPPEEGMTITC